MDTTNRFLAHHRVVKVLNSGTTYRQATPMMRCLDGFEMSVQVSQFFHCSPRDNDASEYTEVEVFSPSEDDELLRPYLTVAGEKPTDCIYGYVPTRIIEKIIENHGGLVTTCHNCDCGQVMFTRTTVITHSMAVDAGDLSLEGQKYDEDDDYDTCPCCHGDFENCAACAKVVFSQDG